MNITKSKTTKKRILAAEDDMNQDDLLDSDDSFEETLDDMSDQLEDMQDSIDEIQEDDIDIEVDNNIEGHYIAECESCQGLFISPVVESDQDIEKVSGVCPICNKETDQYLKWVIKKADHDV